MVERAHCFVRGPTEPAGLSVLNQNPKRSWESHGEREKSLIFKRLKNIPAADQRNFRGVW